jgi:DNA-binding SARP family transcriptional activator
MEIDDLILAGSYEELRRLLESRRGREAGDAVTAAALNALHQLCLTCIQLQQQQEDQHEALRQSIRLENDTRWRMVQLLAAIQGADVAEAAANSHPPNEPNKLASILGDWLARLKKYLEGDVRPQQVGLLYWLEDAQEGAASAAGWSALTPGESRTGPALAESNLVHQLTLESPAAAHEFHPATPAVLDSPSESLEPISGPPPAAPLVAAHDLRVYCLGRFRVCHRDGPIDDWTGHKSRSLFKYFLLHCGQPAPIDQLLDLFWRDSPPEMARRSLHQTIYLLRQSLRLAGERQSIVQVNGGYMLNPELDIWVDSEVFLDHYREGVEAAERGQCDRSIEALLAAETLYEGDFMSEELYEDWPVARREQARNAYLDLLDRLSFHFYSSTQDDRCIAYCRKLLDIDNCREDIHRRLMRLFARRGERSRALRQYRACVDALRAELNVEPLPETVELYAKILNNDFQS